MTDGIIYAIISIGEFEFSSLTRSLVLGLGTLTFTYNLIEENKAHYSGGGVLCYPDSATFTDNIIRNNTAGDKGGGVEFDNLTLTISNTIITGNSALEGGGIYYRPMGNTLTVFNCLIAGNTATLDGAGIYFYRFSLKAPAPGNESLITNSTLVNNQAVARGGGIFTHNIPVVVSNTILWDNTAPEGPEIWIGKTSHTSGVEISYSDLKGGRTGVQVQPDCYLIWGDGMIDADPLFVDAAAGDLHLCHTSPCRDAGDDTTPGLPDEDFEGDPRIAGGAVDMGADEFHTHLYATGNSAPGGTLILNFIGTPGTNPVQLWLGAGIMEPSMPTQYGDWCLNFPLLAQLNLGTMPTPEGVLSLPCPLPPDTPIPLDLPLQAGIGMELSNLCVVEIR